MNIHYLTGTDLTRFEAEKAIKGICDQIQWSSFDKRLSVLRYSQYPMLSIFVKNLDINKFIGYTVMRPWESKTKKNHRFYISFIAITPSYQRKNIGKTLLNKIIDIAKSFGAEKIKLEHKAKEYLRSFYQNATSYPYKYKDNPTFLNNTLFLTYDLRPKT